MVRMTHSSPAASAMRSEVQCLPEHGLRSTLSRLRFRPSTMTASSGGSSSSSASAIRIKSLRRLCRRSCGSRQPVI
jgi:hypothetical protein